MPYSVPTLPRTGGTGLGREIASMDVARRGTSWYRSARRMNQRRLHSDFPTPALPAISPADVFDDGSRALLDLDRYHPSRAGPGFPVIDRDFLPAPGAGECVRSDQRHMFVVRHLHLPGFPTRDHCQGCLGRRGAVDAHDCSFKKAGRGLTWNYANMLFNDGAG